MPGVVFHERVLAAVQQKLVQNLVGFLWQSDSRVSLSLGRVPRDKFYGSWELHS
jgi:hypothetical protein